MSTKPYAWKTTKSIHRYEPRISHTPGCPLGEMRALIWFSRHLASTSCTCYNSSHHHRTMEPSLRLRSALALSILSMTPLWLQTSPPPGMRIAAHALCRDSTVRRDQDEERGTPLHLRATSGEHLLWKTIPPERRAVRASLSSEIIHDESIFWWATHGHHNAVVVVVIFICSIKWRDCESI
jgi:hypothetical protein